MAWMGLMARPSFLSGPVWLLYAILYDLNYIKLRFTQYGFFSSYVLSQRPSLTGSGVTLDALVRHAAESGWEQRVIVGEPVDDRAGRVGGLGGAVLRAVTCSGQDASVPSDLAFPVPGMSDVMPYASTRFSAMSRDDVETYRSIWRQRLCEEIETFRPDVIHAHHAWIVASILGAIESRPPVVVHGHGTGLRQLELCPHLADTIREGCRRCDRFVVLHDDHARRYCGEFGLQRERVHVVGAGYREDLFRLDSRIPSSPGSIVFAGKLSFAKGLHCLLDAVDRLSRTVPDLVLRVAGAGTGEEADELRRRMTDLGQRVEFLGRLDQVELGELLRRSRVFVLPSFFEGLPLVLVEALASGCRLVSTDLPGVRDALAPGLGEALELVPCPPLVSVDVPEPSRLPRFVSDLSGAIRRALEAPSVAVSADLVSRLAPFTWRAVFRRVEDVWNAISR